jgi:hypothetical protein
MGLWRTQDPRLLWLAAADVACTLWLMYFLLTGHHYLAVRVWAVLAWAVVVPGIPVIVRMAHRKRA